MKNRTAADKILRNKAYKIAKDPKYYDSKRGLASIVYKWGGAGGAIVTQQNEQLAEELHKPIIKKSKKGKVY